MNIVLIGARGCGKTTVGRALAAALDFEFLDLDEHVRESFGGQSVSAIWAAHGEQSWREAETRLLAAAFQSGGFGVSALGGGAPVIEEVQGMLLEGRRGGMLFVVYLEAKASTLLRRREQDPGDRPRLAGDSLASEITLILEEREGLYHALSDLICPVSAGEDGREFTPAELVTTILAEVETT